LVVFLQVGSSVPSKLRHIPSASAVIMSKLLLGESEVFFNSMRSTLFLLMWVNAAFLSVISTHYYSHSVSNALDLFYAHIWLHCTSFLLIFFALVPYDFGDSIPGHGGITDRMDCQVHDLCTYSPSKADVLGYGGKKWTDMTYVGSSPVWFHKGSNSVKLSANISRHLPFTQW
jgi:hypothetical protein